MFANTNPYLFTMGSAAVSGTVGLFLNLLTSSGLNSMEVVSLRASVGLLGYAVFLLIADRASFRIQPKDLIFFVITGVGHMILMNWCYFKTIESSSMSVAVVLMYIAPVIIVFSSALIYKESVTAAKLCALVVTFTGCALVTGLIPLSAQPVSVKTFFYGIGAAIGYSVYPIAGKSVLQKYGPSTVSFYTFLFASLVSVPTSGLIPDFHLLFSWKAFLGVLGVGGFCTIFSYAIYNIGLRRADPGKASILATIELFVATLLGVIFFHDTLTIFKVIGMFAICGAVVLLNLPARENSKTPAKPAS